MGKETERFEDIVAGGGFTRVARTIQKRVSAVARQK